MNIDDIKQKLKTLDSDVVKDFVMDLYIQYPELKQQIETLILFDDPKALTKAINKRIQSVNCGRKFIDYRMGFQFARDLESITADIEKGVLEKLPKQAFELADKFLKTSPKVMERCDDSSGDIGGVYRSGILLWLTAAKQWQDKNHNWLECVYQLYQENDYGVYDPLLPNSHLLLTKDELTQLAWRFESELRQAIKPDTDKGSYNFEASKSNIGLSSVAEALKDSALYERAMLIQSPEPNELQKKSLVEMYLKFNQTEMALKWLATPWSNRFSRDRLKLLDKTYQLNGDKGQLKCVRRDLYLASRSYLSLCQYIELLSDSEKKSAITEAITLAEKGENLLTNIDLLIKLDCHPKAEQLLLNNITGIENFFYNNLVDMAKQFEQLSCWLATAACYRVLLLDILQQGRSTAYSHAARYFKLLIKLDELITDYRALDTHELFVEKLELNHARKSSFWQRVNTGSGK